MSAPFLLAIIALLAILFVIRKPLQSLINKFTTPKSSIPVSVNYHFTRFCNYSCGFCFHVSKNKHIASKDYAKKALRLLKQAGMRKNNFAGGEAFLYPDFLGEMPRFCKQDPKMESVSIVTNGSKVTEKFIRKHAAHLNILAVSCDSFDEAVNTEIGRAENGKPADQVRKLYKMPKWCNELGIKFKLNSVVNALNWKENMAPVIKRLGPVRWKVFEVLLVESENDSIAKDRKGDFDKFYLSDEDFEAFCEKHKHLKCFVPESNKLMANSYLILDEYLPFLDKGDGLEDNSDCILKVGVAKALKQVNRDEESFHARGGIYEWSVNNASSGSGCGGGVVDSGALEW